MRARLATIAAAGGLALVAAPQALADPIPVAPDAGETFTARVRPTFQASTTAVPAPGLIRFYVSRAEMTNDGVLLNQIDSFLAGPDDSVPPVYEARPAADTDWPNRPRTYYWQAVYNNCLFADPNCYSAVRSLTIDPLPPPTETSPEDEAAIPFGREATFSVQDVPSYRRAGTHVFIEFATSSDRRPNGRLEDRYLTAEPRSLGEGVYQYQGTDLITTRPGTHYWIVERFDCDAEPDCYVTDDEIRSFTVASPATPNTVITRHPPRRTRKRKVRFAFSSTVPGASFQCFYTRGWSRCRSPQRFRRLEPGRYRFKVRALAAGKRDATPARWLFKVLPRRH